MKYLFTYLLLLVSFNMQAQLKVNSGTQVINNGTIVLDNTSLINNGSFLNNNGANVIFKGTGNHSISGSGMTTFYGLELNKQSDNILVQKSIKVAGPLRFTKGSLDLTSNSVQLIYPDGLLQNESEQNRILSTGNGFLHIEQSLNAPVNSNPGNLGFIITSSNNLGTTVVYRGHDQQTKANGDQSIRRYYSIVPEMNNTISASYTFSYLDAEFDGQPEISRKLHEKTGTAEWQQVVITGLNTQDNIINVTGVSSLQKYTLFPAGTALPLQLLGFSARCKDQGAMLQWITANEVQTKQFIIETSYNGVTWQPIYSVQAQGNTSQHTYLANVSTGAPFVRLKMEDMDGKFTYSPVKKVDCTTSQKIVAGPNPTRGEVIISVTADVSKRLTIEVSDISGRILQSKIWQLNQGLNSRIVDLTKYPSATYMIMVKDGGKNEMFRIVKQ